jgi:hypothetical protein
MAEEGTLPIRRLSGSVSSRGVFEIGDWTLVRAAPPKVMEVHDWIRKSAGLSVAQALNPSDSHQ